MSQIHYFTDNSGLPSNRREITFQFSGRTFTFVTDDGVFSKDGVDQGTKILLKNAVCTPLSGSVLDLGCGYGTVGIVVKTMFPECSVTCSDVNSRALELTELNAEKNKATVRAVMSDRFDSLADHFDMILTNPPIRAGKAVVHGILSEAYDHLNRGGVLLAVIRRKQGAESAVRKIAEVFGSCEVIDRDKGYWILKGIRN